MWKATVIGIGILCFALTGCFEVVNTEELQDEAIEIRKQLDELQSQKKALYTELSQKKKAIRDFDRVRNREAQLRLEYDPIEKYVSSLEIADEYLETQLAIWRKATRESLKDFPIGTFRTLSGATISKGVVVEVRDEDVVIKFDGGERAFPWNDLPEPVKLALVHEPTVTMKSRLSNF